VAQAPLVRSRKQAHGVNRPASKDRRALTAEHPPSSRRWFARGVSNDSARGKHCGRSRNGSRQAGGSRLGRVAAMGAQQTLEAMAAQHGPSPYRLLPTRPVQPTQADRHHCTTSNCRSAHTHPTHRCWLAARLASTRSSSESGYREPCGSRSSSSSNCCSSSSLCSVPQDRSKNCTPQSPTQPNVWVL
jgi:hypothetical protein